VSTAHRRRWLATPLPALVIALALAALVADAGSVPHAHLGGEPGLYNQEHDLSALAAFGAGGPLPGAAALPAALVVVAALVPAVSLATSAPRRPADSRAPPAR